MSESDSVTSLSCKKKSMVIVTLLTSVTVYFCFESLITISSDVFRFGQRLTSLQNILDNEFMRNSSQNITRGEPTTTNDLQTLTCVERSFLEESVLRSELKKLGLEPAEDHAFKSKYIVTPKVCVPANSVPAAHIKGNRRTKIISCFQCPSWFSSRGNLRNRDFRSCRYDECLFDFNGKYRSESDVLIFFVGYLRNVTPPSRPPGQIWVKAFFESPVHYDYPVPYEAWQDVFNWTFTYRSDSDIFAPSTLLSWRDSSLLLADDQYLEIAKSKNRTAAWFVSNCNTQSKRKEYVKEMQKYIDVDIYGECGALSCPRGGRQCEAFLNKTYKFYLSFENSFCFDYVTEKVMYRFATRTHVVPVVRGGFNYSRYLPAGCYVDAVSFPSAKELALHLKALGEDHQRYARMLKEKDRLVALGYKNDYCDLCEKIHTDTATKIIRDIRQWSHHGTCYSAKDIT